MTQNNLGSAYAGLLAGDRAANLQRAIGCYTEALRFRTAEAAPLDYAGTQNNLGLAYAGLPAGDRADNLQRAIACYTEALRFYTAQAAPLDYASTQHNLGNVYRGLPAGDRAANLQRAIACYTQALRFYTAQAAPLDYAGTQHNLGTAYAELPTGDRAANLQRAIACYTESLRFRTAEATPLDYAETQNNLGAAYAWLPTGDQAADLQRAIACYRKALRFYTAQVAPLRYAGTQNNLGTAYAGLPAGDRAADLQRAIACYRKALRFYTAKAAPLDYAQTQNNLGNAYAALPAGDRAANLRRAIGCYTRALRFRTAEAAPAEHRQTALNLASLHFSESRWEQAHDSYASAIAAGDLLYQAGATEAGRQAELRHVGQAVADDAYCLARLGRFTEAVEQSEGGRTRALAEALARDRASLAEAKAEDRAAFEEARDRIKTLESAARAGHDSDSPQRAAQSFLEFSADLALARTNLAETIERIRAYVPAFMTEGLTQSEISEAASPARPLAYLLTTRQGSLALIVTADGEPLGPDQAVWLHGFTTDALDRLLVRRDAAGEVSGGYLLGQVGGGRPVLSQALKQALPLLRDELLGPPAEYLRALGVCEATIVPVGRLSLLPLPAAMPEDITITLALSARTLRAAKTAGPDRWPLFGLAGSGQSPAPPAGPVSPRLRRPGGAGHRDAVHGRTRPGPRRAGRHQGPRDRKPPRDHTSPPRLPRVVRCRRALGFCPAPCWHGPADAPGPAGRGPGPVRSPPGGAVGVPDRDHRVCAGP